MLENLVARPTIDDQTTEESRRWFERAQKVLAGGISSSARAFGGGSLTHPLYMAGGQGSHIWDLDGHEFIDYLLSYGSVILGHAHLAQQAALIEQIEQGTMFGTCNMLEVQLAEEICRLVPGADLVRYANSGSEAMSGAVRAARGFTGKNKIIKFEGHYHGWLDQLAISNRPALSDAGPSDRPNSAPHSRGIPQSVVADVIICPWNDPNALTQILDEHAGQIAAIVAEPIVANNACIMPQPGYLEFLRSQCDLRDIVLIFDEIVTGFRVAPGGAQQLFGVIPDISVFSKALGGGLPISAFAGKHKIMDLIGANKIKHGGTYNGNPLCATGALVALQTISAAGALDELRNNGEIIIDVIKCSAAKNHVACLMQGLGSMFQIVFGAEKPPRNYRELLTSNTETYGRFRQAMLDQGIHINSSGMACWFISLAHSEEDVETTCQAIEIAMKQIA